MAEPMSECDRDSVAFTRVSAGPAPAFDGAKDVSLLLYTQKNPLNPEYIQLNNDSSSPSFNPMNPTRVVIHGWIANSQKLQPYRKAYIATGREHNIILVDWSGPACKQIFEARKNSLLVGDYVGKVMNQLMRDRALSADDLVVIGHSMGAHMAAIVGNRVGGRIAAIVALDPASIYDDLPLEDQVDISDAKFVQVIHTNGGVAGILASRGHADFFPNGGSIQIGCEVFECSHIRAHEYYVESITSKDFIATRCPNNKDFSNGKCSTNEHVIMGEWTPLNTSGTFYLHTNEKAPFAKGQKNH